MIGEDFTKADIIPFFKQMLFLAIILTIASLLS